MKRKDDGSGTYKQPVTRPLPRAELPPIGASLDEHQHDDTPTMVKCPTCAGASPAVGKIGCQTCVGAGFVTYERYFAMTQRCPLCIGSGRVTNEQADALAIDAKRRESDR